MQTLAVFELARHEPTPARERVEAKLLSLASGPTPPALEGEFRDLLAIAAQNLSCVALLDTLMAWYSEGTAKDEALDAVLGMLRDPDLDVPATRAAALLRALASLHTSDAGPLCAGLGCSRHIEALATAVEEHGRSVIPGPEDEFPIGEVTLPSGNPVLVDMGALGQWSHEEPHFADLSGSTWAGVAGASHGDFRDMQATGPDAAAALEAFVRTHATGYLYDVNAPQSERAMAMFDEVAANDGLDARLERAPTRVGHGRRVRMLAQTGLETAGFSFAHVNAVTVHRLPAEVPLQVVGRRTEDDTWAYVSLVCRDTEPVSSQKVDTPGVEEARMIFADAETLAHWDHERSQDGLVDLVFWGGRGPEFGERFGLEPDAQGQYGWFDLPPTALPPGWFQAIIDASEARQLAVDFRWHSSHHAILRHAWASEVGVGSAQIGGSWMCGLFSSVGDGGFPVHVERDRDGRICRVTVHIDGDPDEA